MSAPVQSIASSISRKSVNFLHKLASPSLIALAALLGAGQSAHATSYQYHGLIDLDYGSSIAGAPKHTRYFIDFVLDGAVLDTDHTVFENDITNVNNVRGLTTMGSFSSPIISMKLTLDPTSVGTLDLSGLNFDSNSSWARAVDANQPPNPQAPPCDVYPCIGEHITLESRVNTPGSPVSRVWLNLYNSNFYEPIFASRQLLLDTSASGDPFTFADLFLHGPETLTEFQSYRPPNITELRDPVLFTGPNGTSAAGRFLSLAYVPPSAPGPLPMMGVAAGLAWSRRLRQRTSAPSRGTVSNRQSCNHPESR
jgi:hypothetical protein